MKIFPNIDSLIDELQDDIYYYYLILYEMWSMLLKNWTWFQGSSADISPGIGFITINLFINIIISIINNNSY